jgi:hypothetical protein
MGLLPKAPRREAARVGVANPPAADASGNALIALQQWVEGGVAPQRLVATNTSPGRARPMSLTQECALHRQRLDQRCF